MVVLLQRRWESPECIQGSLSIDGASECFTLELPLLFEGQENVPQKTCIPAGTYDVTRKYSPRFEQMMPHLENVPGRRYIEIHWANWAREIHGCIAVGESRISDNEIGQSREAFEALNRKLENAWAAGESIRLEIRNITFLNNSI